VAGSERTLLMIPGPIELEPEVLRVLGRPQLGHMDAEVARAFGRALTNAREVFQAPGGQPFIVTGSGTLAMELAVANVIDPGERAVVVNTGYFSDRMRAILERLGARVDEVRAPLGEAPDAAASSGRSPRRRPRSSPSRTSTRPRACARRSSPWRAPPASTARWWWSTACAPSAARSCARTPGASTSA
jgi:hypothetical protein